MESITLLIVLYKVFAIGICSIRFSILENNNSSGDTIGWTNELGHSIINKVEFLIGGVVIDTIDGNWLDIYSNFYMEESKRDLSVMLADATTQNLDIQDEVK